MSTHYDEDDINEQNARDLYYTIRDAIKQSQQAEISLSLAGIAAAIADEIDDVSELTKLVAELDWQIEQKINQDAVMFGNATKKANEGNSVAMGGIAKDNTGLLKEMNEVFFGGVNKALGL